MKNLNFNPPHAKEEAMKNLEMNQIFGVMLLASTIWVTGLTKRRGVFNEPFVQVALAGNFVASGWLLGKKDDRVITFVDARSFE